MLELDAPILEGENANEGRWGAYELRDGEPHCVCSTPTLEGVGGMLEMLASDRDEYHAEHGGTNVVPVLAIFDRVERRWLTSLWYPGRKNG